MIFLNLSEKSDHQFLADIFLKFLSLYQLFGDVYKRQDWPLVNISRYSSFLSEVIPARFWEGVFFENANRIYRLGL